MTAARMLKAARRRAGVTQRELAQASGVPQPSIARIERGTTIPRVDTFVRLLRASGQDVSVEPRLGEGVDRTHIRALLAMTPAERAESAAAAGRNLLALRTRVRLDRSTGS
jgi:transcriptional regulator with XRE-family HTH domain